MKRKVSKMFYMMVIKKIYILFLLGLLVFSSNSCSDDTIVTPPDNTIITPPKMEYYDYNYNELNPGRVGSYWKYLGFFRSNEWERDSNWVYSGLDSFNLDLSEKAWYVIDSTKREIVGEIDAVIGNSTYLTRAFTNTRVNYAGNIEKTKWLYWNGEDGVYSMGGYTAIDTLFEKRLRIKYPVEQGENWEEYSVLYTGEMFFTRETIFTKCIATNETITTPFGTFECYVILSRKIIAEDAGGYDDFYQYFSPNIGLVCQVVLSIPPDASYVSGVLSLLFVYDYSIN